MKILQDGETCLAKVTLANSSTGEKHKYKVLYGNHCVPLDGGSLDRMPEEQYRQALQRFLDKHPDYEEPDQQKADSSAAEEVTNAASAKPDGEAASNPQQQQEIEELKAALARERESHQQDLMRYEADQQTSPVQQDVETLATDADNDETEEEEDENDAGKQAKHIRVLLVLLTILSLFSLCFSFVSAAGMFISMEQDESSKQTTTDKTTLTINGNEYEITTSQTELDNGESVISVYGLKTTNDNGEKKNEVIPLGEIKISTATGTVADKTENAQETATPEPSADTQ